MGGSNSLTVKVADEKTERTAVAVYLKESLRYILHVQSYPITEVQISYSGDFSGTEKTNFDMESKSPFVITLNAPAVHQNYKFDHWEASGIGEEGRTIISEFTKLEIIVKREITAKAYYTQMSEAFISKIQWNREPPIASLNSFYYSEGMAREHGMFIWWDGYYLEGIYAYVTVQNPTDSTFYGKIIWNLISPDGSYVCSETVPGGLVFLEVASHDSKNIKLFIRNTQTFPSELKPGTYTLEVKLAKKTGLTSYEVTDTLTSSIKLVDNEPAVTYPIKDVDRNGDLEPIMGKVFTFFDPSVDFEKLSLPQKIIVAADILFSLITIAAAVPAGLNDVHEPVIAETLLATSPALETAEVKITDKGLQKTSGSVGIKTLQIDWWNVVHYPEPGFASFFGANYDRAIITVIIPTCVDIVDKGGAHLCFKDDKNFYLVWIETGVDKLIKPSGSDEYTLPIKPNGQYTIKIEPKPWNQIKKIEIKASVALQFGPFGAPPSPDSLIYNYTKWIEDPENVYWGTVGLDGNCIEVDIPTIESGTIVSLHETQHKLYLHIYDSDGRHVGFNHESNQTEIQIPGATYEDLGNGIIIILPCSTTNFKTVIDAKSAQEENESYELTVVTVKDNEVIDQKNVTSNIKKEAKHAYDVQISPQGEIVTIQNEETVPWWVQHQLWTITGVIATVAALIISIALNKKRKAYRPSVC
jgi:hypothetical protein